MIRKPVLLMTFASLLGAAEPDPRADFHYTRTGDEAVIAPIAGLTGDALTLAFQVGAQGFDQPGRLLALRDAAGKSVVSLELRRAGKDPAMTWWDDPQQNYLRWAGPDGTVLVLEAVMDVAIAPPYRASMKKQVRVGVPVALLGPKPQRILVRMRPGKADIVVDGQIVDEEWPCGGPARPIVDFSPGANVAEASVWKTWLDDAVAGVRPTPGFESGELTAREFQYWSPPGHNRWAGDTMFYNDGDRLHLMYLSDRRHGASKNSGAHQIAHLSTTDLKTWSVHPMAVPITEPWETLGTGNMVKYNGRWFLLYGMHTDRIVEPAAVATLKGNEPQPFDSLSGPPIGTAIASSDDGIHFRKDRLLVHPAQNPSVVPDPRGGFAMFAGYGADGLYHSDDLLHWTAVDNFIVPFNEGAPMRNSTECFSHLAWNGWHYILGGRTGFWMSKDFAGPYWDQDSDEGKATAQKLAGYFKWRLKGAPPMHPRPPGKVTVPRWDVYDGLWVPMVAEATTGRRILAGWLEDLDRWAGCLVLRELHQEPDGNLTLSWLPEGMPLTGPSLALKWSGTPGATLHADQGKSVSISADNLPDEFLFEAEVDASAGVYSVVLGGSGDLKDGCELRVEPARQRAQWGTPAQGKPAPEVPDVRTIFATEDGHKPVFNQKSKNLPFHGGDFAITDIAGLDRPHRIRVLFIQDRKSGSVIIDAEIDGRRTMITRRRGLTGHRIELVAISGSVQFSEPTVRPVTR
jgi:hypothetical protein